MKAKLATLMIACSLLAFVPSVEAGHKACHDGVDNDGDGKTDYPADPGCNSSNDNNEYNAPPAACGDGSDNDSDGVADYPSDPGCSSASDSSERGSLQCDDGSDNDSDGYNNYPNDAGCTGPSDNNERTACQDSTDNDGDGVADGSDPGCSGTQDTSERGTVQCDDGLDNDEDGTADYPQDSDCTGPGDGDEEGHEPCLTVMGTACLGECSGYYTSPPPCWTVEDHGLCDWSMTDDCDVVCDNAEGTLCPSPATTQCSDGVDNDGDGWTDYPIDTDCSNTQDTFEGHDSCVAVEGICTYDCPEAWGGGLPEPCHEVLNSMGLCEFQASGDCEVGAPAPSVGDGSFNTIFGSVGAGTSHQGEVDTYQVGGTGSGCATEVRWQQYEAVLIYAPHTDALTLTIGSQSITGSNGIAVLAFDDWGSACTGFTMKVTGSSVASAATYSFTAASAEKCPVADPLGLCM